MTVPPTNGVVTLTVSGTLDFTSFCTFAVAVSNTAGSPVSLDDIQLTYAMNATTNRVRGGCPSVCLRDATTPRPCPPLQFIVGMGQSGSESVNVSWNWSNTTATNKLWMGRAEAGLVVNLNGDG